MLKPLRTWMTGCYRPGCGHRSDCHDLDQSQGRTAANAPGMAFDPRRVFSLEAAGIATIIASALVMAGVVYSGDDPRFELAQSA